MAPSIVNVAVGIWETEHVYSSRYMEHVKKLRFIDDIFVIWERTESHLEEFVTYLGTIIGFLKFASHCIKTKISFMDLLIKKHGSRITQSLLWKPTRVTTPLK